MRVPRSGGIVSEFEKLQGKTVVRIEGGTAGDEVAVFHCEDGSRMSMRS